jgi:hypothetical protein
VGRIVSEIPASVQRLGERIAQAQERIATIERELVRLETWDGQPTYDAAVSELSAINAAFAAAEEEAAAARAPAPVQPAEEAGAAREPTPVQPAGEAPTASAPALTEATLAEELLALARQEQAATPWELQATIIPPAPASLVWMAAEVERLTMARPSHLEAMAAVAPEEAEVPVLAGKIGPFHPASPVRVQFGNTLVQRRAPRPEVSQPAHSEAEVHQLSLF